MKTKIKNYEICNSTISNHLGAILTITKITKTLGFCEFSNKDGRIVFPITKNKNVWFGNYLGVNRWQFNLIKRNSCDRIHNNLEEAYDIKYKLFNCLTPDDSIEPDTGSGLRIGPGTGTGENSSGGGN